MPGNRRDGAVDPEEAIAFRRQRSSATLLVLLVVAALAVGGTPATASQDAGPKILRTGWGGPKFPRTLEPQQTDEEQGSTSFLAFEGLTRLDEDFNTVPAAAESWQFSEGGLTLTFHLREGLVYSDGSAHRRQGGG